MEPPIRVAEVMGYMNGGGVEAVVMNYYRHIDRTRVRFDLIVCEGSTLIPRDEIESLGGRVFNVVFSAAVLVVFCWLFAIIAILIKVDDPKDPVFFSQERVGKDGRTFRMLKFRSMCVDAEDRLAEKTGPVFKIAEDPRITRVGKWLRKLSLDELPQFINVLRADMSIVGPRPALPAEIATYDDYQRQRLLVKPA